MWSSWLAFLPLRSSNSSNSWRAWKLFRSPNPNEPSEFFDVSAHSNLQNILGPSLQSWASCSALLTSLRNQYFVYKHLCPSSPSSQFSSLCLHVFPQKSFMLQIIIWQKSNDLPPGQPHSLFKEMLSVTSGPSKTHCTQSFSWLHYKPITTSRCTRDTCSWTLWVLPSGGDSCISG